MTYNYVQNAVIADAIEELKQLPGVFYHLVELVEEVDDEKESPERRHQVADNVYFMLRAITNDIEMITHVLESYYFAEKPTRQPQDFATTNEEERQ